MNFLFLKIQTARWFLAILGFFVFGLFLNQALASPGEDLEKSLRQQINDLQSQIDQYRSNIKNLQQQGKTLNREISLLDNRIKQAILEIKRTNLAVQETENGISNKNVELGKAEEKINREKDILAINLRQIYERDDEGILEMLLKNQKLSEVFEEVNSLQTLQKNINGNIAQIRDLKVTLESDKETLENKREELNQLKVLQQIQKQAVAAEQEEKKNLLSETKGREENYQNLLQKARQDAASIRNNLYLLEGVGVSMPLEKAYQYAKIAGSLTGVRPAFLLAVLKKETSWGINLGSGNWRKDMKPSEQKAFLQISEKLGKNPDTTPVSAKPWYGWGGAMGPAQFLPTTWLAYEERIARLTGHNPPDPWDIEDAFTAAGIKLAQGGASSRNYDAEWKAAQVYFAGSRWNNPTYYFYGDQVMELAGVIQDQLNIIAR